MGRLPSHAVNTIIPLEKAGDKSVGRRVNTHARRSVSSHIELKATSHELPSIGQRFRCTMRGDCGQLDSARSSGPSAANGTRVFPERLDEEELADWRARHNAVYPAPPHRPRPRGQIQPYLSESLGPVRFNRARAAAGVGLTLDPSYSISVTPMRYPDARPLRHTAF